MAVDPQLIRESFALVEGSADKVASHLYAKLFLEDPSLRNMFPPMMDGQRGLLMNAVARIAYQADDPVGLAEYLAQLGRDHRRFGVRPEHYETMSRCLIAAMRKYARAGTWTQEMDEAWLEVFGAVAEAMIGAADQAARTSPAWWTGRVIEHELLSGSIALLTVQPDQPYPFRAGQYAAVETLRWPRVWRPYSFANAPRRDGLLSFQVRAQDGGWVSSALVHHTRAGDTLRIGPAMGSMVCDPESGRDAVLIGGGTGIAPMLSIAQDLARRNTHRQVHVFFGAPRFEDLYAMPVLDRLRTRHPWLTVVPCVSSDTRYRGELGMLPDVVMRHGNRVGGWQAHDVYLAGPVAMMQSALSRLIEGGVPGRRIRFDAVGPQAALLGGMRRAESAMLPLPMTPERAALPGPGGRAGGDRGGAERVGGPPPRRADPALRTFPVVRIPRLPQPRAACPPISGLITRTADWPREGITRRSRARRSARWAPTGRSGCIRGCAPPVRGRSRGPWRRCP